MNDGAAAVIVASEEWAEREGREPLAQRRSPTGRSPTTSPTWPGPRRRPRSAALEKIGKSPEDVDLWEINEAFASVALNSVRMLGVDDETAST